MNKIKLTPRRAAAIARYIRKTPQSIRGSWIHEFWGNRRGEH